MKDILHLCLHFYSSLWFWQPGPHCLASRLLLFWICEVISILKWESVVRQWETSQEIKQLPQLLRHSKLDPVYPVCFPGGVNWLPIEDVGGEGVLWTKLQDHSGNIWTGVFWHLESPFKQKEACWGHKDTKPSGREGVGLQLWDPQNSHSKRLNSTSTDSEHPESASWPCWGVA